MTKNKSHSEDILSAEIKEAMEIESSGDLTQNVMNGIEYKLIRKSQIKTALILTILLFFLFLSVIIVFYLDGIYHISESVNIRFSTSIWSYRFIPVVILSLSIIYIIDKILIIRKT